MSALGCDFASVCSFVVNDYRRFQAQTGGWSTFEFLVFGSYAAHIKMLELGFPNPVVFNDIDVMHMDEEFSNYIAGKDVASLLSKKPKKSALGKDLKKELKAIQYVPFNGKFEINYVCVRTATSLEARVAEADINCVAVGCVMNFNNMTGSLTARWIETSAFRAFLMTNIIAPCSFLTLSKPRNALSTLVRLLHKAQQSKLRCAVPTDSDITSMCHGRSISLETIEKYGDLEPMRRQMIDSLLFYIIETNQKHGTKMWRFFSRNVDSKDLHDQLSSVQCFSLVVSGTVHEQVGGTCYANAIATAIRATENRIIGRTPMSHEAIVQDIVAKHGDRGGFTFGVLREECAKRRLGCCIVLLENLVEVLQANRTLVVKFDLSEDVWTALSNFFRAKPQGILTMQDIERYRPDHSLPRQGGGHAVCLRGLRYASGLPYVELKNSWGTNFADNGMFKIGLDVVNNPTYGFSFFDVFFRICDLLPQDLHNFAAEQARLREMKAHMSSFDY